MNIDQFSQRVAKLERKNRFEKWGDLLVGVISIALAIILIFNPTIFGAEIKGHMLLWPIGGAFFANARNRWHGNEELKVIKEFLCSDSDGLPNK